jgi:hypothetical protein
MYETQEKRPSARSIIRTAGFVFLITFIEGCHSHPRFLRPSTYNIHYDSVPFHSILDSLKNYDYLIILKGDSTELANNFVPVTFHASNVTFRDLLDTIFYRQPRIDYFYFMVGSEIIIQKK